MSDTDSSANPAQSQEHSPLPWSAYGGRIDFKYDIWDAYGNCVADVETGFVDEATNCANAEFIVRACNSHEELVQAAKLLLTFAIMVRGTMAPSSPELDEVRAVIKRAEGRS